MENIKDYLSSPSTWIAFIVFIFGLGVCYATLNSRIQTLEKEVSNIDYAQIQSTLAQIQTDITWIKLNLSSK